MTSLLDGDLASVDVPAPVLAVLARAVSAAATAEDAPKALSALAGAARAVSCADVALVRALDVEGGQLEAVAVAGSRALAAELDGTTLPAAELPAAPLDGLEQAPAAVRRAAERARASQLLLIPARASGSAVSLELFRSGDPFTPVERLAAELCAWQAALALRAFAGAGSQVVSLLAWPSLELAGEALAAAAHEGEAEVRVARLAARATRATAVILWTSRDGVLVSDASYGLEDENGLTAARELAVRTLAEPGRVQSLAASRLPQGCGVSTTVPLGRPPFGVLQLLHPPGDEPAADELDRLATFGVRAADALGAARRAGLHAAELERTQAQLEVIAQATAELSVSHTLETAIERVAELLDADRVAVYLRTGEDGALAEAACRGLSGSHARVAERLLDLALGPSPDGAVLEVENVGRDPRLAGVAAAAGSAAIGAALAVPLVARGRVTGLLVAYPRTRLAAKGHRTALLAALAGQLAVAVRNAQLHEETARLGEEREAALVAERTAARRLRALYEVSRSFAQSLSLDETLEALARTVVDVLELDAAVVRMPDERRDLLLPLALHVRDPHIEEAIRTVLLRPQPFGQRSVQRLFRERAAFRLTPEDDFLPLLAPFLEKGWTAAVVPVALPTEVLASLGVFSFRPGEPVSEETVDAAAAIAGQAALAIDNARLYQQQKQFADTMQRSLLPRSRPSVSGLEVGEVYEPSARMEVGGDVYDFLALEDGRLAVALGDVTGHGVAATADMAMAKFVFRSLAREHPEPADFLAAANDVICSEIGSGKFISMSYVVVDGGRGTVVGASAGHPAPRIVLPDGRVRALEARGLVLGIDAGQKYAEARAELPSGAGLVLYTDGVVEARRDGELYGYTRLETLLQARHELPARALAAAIAEDAREFTGGDLSDDLAVVVIRKT